MTCLRLRKFVVVCGLIWAIGCAGEPSEFPARFDRALASGDLAEVLPLLTADSRPLVTALLASRGAAAIGLGAHVKPTQLLAIQPQGTRLVLQVKAGGENRDWVLLEENGAWRLDLAETMVRRPWNAQ